MKENRLLGLQFLTEGVFAIAAFIQKKILIKNVLFVAQSFKQARRWVNGRRPCRHPFDNIFFI